MKAGGVTMYARRKVRGVGKQEGEEVHSAGGVEKQEVWERRRCEKVRSEGR